jgi:hypothetical protein
MSHLPDPTEETLRRVLGRFPQPRPSPFFAARLTATVRTEAPRRCGLLVAYWALYGLGVLALLAAYLSPAAFQAAALVLGPLGFALALYGRGLLRRAAGWIGPWLG